MYITVYVFIKGTLDGEKFHLASCMSTLALFCKVKPKLMIKHATTLQPYLSTQCNVRYLVLLYIKVAVNVVSTIRIKEILW